MRRGKYNLLILGLGSGIAQVLEKEEALANAASYHINTFSVVQASLCIFVCLVN